MTPVLAEWSNAQVLLTLFLRRCISVKFSSILMRAFTASITSLRFSAVCAKVS